MYILASLPHSVFASYVQVAKFLASWYNSSSVNSFMARFCLEFSLSAAINFVEEPKAFSG